MMRVDPSRQGLGRFAGSLPEVSGPRRFRYESAPRLRTAVLLVDLQAPVIIVGEMRQDSTAVRAAVDTGMLSFLTTAHYPG